MEHLKHLACERPGVLISFHTSGFTLGSRDTWNSEGGLGVLNWVPVVLKIVPGLLFGCPGVLGDTPWVSKIESCDVLGWTLAVHWRLFSPYFQYKLLQLKITFLMTFSTYSSL